MILPLPVYNEDGDPVASIKLMQSNLSELRNRVEVLERITPNAFALRVGPYVLTIIVIPFFLRPDLVVE